MYSIYKYTKKTNNKVVYIGQTNNVEYRRYQHERYDPFAPNVVEYNYPLSRGIRKYGVQEYQFDIIEKNIETINEAIKKEAYWIKYYDTYNNGYNQTPGGKAPKYIKFTPGTIALAKQMIKEGINFNVISQQTGISVPHLSEINTGKRHHDTLETYPLNKMTRGRITTDEQIEQAIDLLSHTKLTQREIAEQVGITPTTISRINKGKAFKQENIKYPIRKLRKSRKK